MVFEKKIIVLYGGDSSEREVSLESGEKIYLAILELGYEASLIDYPNEFSPDFFQEYNYVFIALHGKDGESGDLQKYLLESGIEYSGSNQAACANTWNKARCKELLKANNIPTPKWISIPELSEDCANFFLLQQGNPFPSYPFFLKPEEDGSSIDVFKILNNQDMQLAIKNCTNKIRPFIVEESIDYREVTVPILNGVCLPSVEIITSESFYNYDAKYLRDDTQLIRTSLSAEEHEKLDALCIKTFNALGCKGWARIDLLQDLDGTFYILEVNTVPGMTSHSLFPSSAKIAGLDYKSLVREIIESV
jgi:D-alanine-D-alanine ligase